MAWVCRSGEQGLSVMSVRGPKRAPGPEFGVERCAAGAEHELRFADRISAEWFLLVFKGCFPGYGEFGVTEADNAD